MTTSTRHADDQATRLREMVARLDRARDARVDSRAGPERSNNLPAQTAPARSAIVIAIASGKGGVGKSNIAVNLSAAFARRRVRTILMDGDFGLPNADLLCGVRVSANLGDALEPSFPIERVLVDAPGGFRLAPGATSVTARSITPEQRGDLVDRLARVGSAPGFVVVDCGAGLGDDVLALLDAADVTLLITTPEPTAIADAYALLKRRINATTGCAEARLAPRLVVNQCADEREALATHSRIDAAAAKFLGVRVTLAGWAPTDAAAPDAVRARTPFVIAAPRCDASRAVKRLAGSLTKEFMPGVGGSRRGFWRRVFRLGGV